LEESGLREHHLVFPSPIPLPVIDSASGTIEETSEYRLQMNHIMHYLDNQTGKNRAIVVFTLYPGSNITREIAKDGREVLFHIRSPHRLLAKEFVNPEKIQEDGYDIFDDDPAQCMMAFFKSYSPQAYTYKVDLPLPVLTHPDLSKADGSFQMAQDPYSVTSSSRLTKTIESRSKQVLFREIYFTVLTNHYEYFFTF
jgi:hypothetical protein